MHSLNERNEAINIFMKFKSYSRTVKKLGYPNSRTLRRWVEEYNKNGFIHDSFRTSNNNFYKNRYSGEQINIAIKHYLEYGECISFTVRELGYPSKDLLKKWLLNNNKIVNKIICSNNSNLNNSNNNNTKNIFSMKESNINNKSSPCDIINKNKQMEVDYMKDKKKKQKRFKRKFKY